ncbi:hypothetical protein yinte0001_25450 [Yersinia intermedia ATCC 29909]|nr:hypothetical protein yinte0001_25450 [Yersinia intermedia ATCC 29909]
MPPDLHLTVFPLAPQVATIQLHNGYRQWRSKVERLAKIKYRINLIKV